MILLKTLIASVLTAVAFSLAAPVAEAHYPPISGTPEYAYDAVYEEWNHRCGEGDAWACNKRRGNHTETKYGKHSYIVAICWVDTKGTKWVYTAWKQWCVYQRVGHGYLAELVKPSDTNVNNGKVLNHEG